MVRRITTLAGLALACSVSVSQAQDAPKAPAAAAPIVIVNPDWLRRPSGDDLSRAFPAGPATKGIGGKVEISCVVSVTGALRSCQVVSETPAGLGFGAAALVMSSQFLMKPAMRNGAPVEASVRVPINFQSSSGSNERPDAGDIVRTFANTPWEAAPTIAQTLAAYPPAARDANLSGRVAMDCVLGKQGVLRGCEIMEELPVWKGFGASAKKLLPYFRGPTQVSGASTVGIHTRLNIAFNPALAKLGDVDVPSWRALPTVAQLKAAVASQPKLAGKPYGVAELRCTISDTGGMTACSLVKESSEGFGDAALGLAPLFMASAWGEDGTPVVGGVTNLTLTFGKLPAVAQK
jgi:TonB family protein